MNRPRPHRLRRSQRVWLAAGRAMRPVTACAVALAGVLLQRPEWRREARSVLSGDASLTGPSRTMRTACGACVSRGIFSEAQLSDQMNLELDAAVLNGRYVAAIGPKNDAALLAKGLWATLLAPRVQAAGDSDHFTLFDVFVNNSETDRVLDMVESMVGARCASGHSEGEEPLHVTFVNANNFNLARTRPEYLRVLRRSDLVLPDGIGVRLGLQMAGGRLRRNLNGTDLFPHLAKLFSENGWAVFLLGGEPQVLRRAEANIRRRFPKLRIAGSQDGYFAASQEPEIAARIAESGAAAVIVGMGTPRQELWFGRNADRLGVPAVFCMGGLIDFLGEKNRRAPLWMRQAGLEWVFRILQEPGRMWRRYLIGNPVFLWRVARWSRARRETSPNGGTTDEDSRRNRRSVRAASDGGTGESRDRRDRPRLVPDAPTSAAPGGVLVQHALTDRPGSQEAR